MNEESKEQPYDMDETKYLDASSIQTYPNRGGFANLAAQQQLQESSFQQQDI